MIKSWFDPNWMGATVVSHVLRVYGISILQPLSNVVYHAVISIGASILIVQSISTSIEPWLSKRWTAIALAVFVVAAITMSLTFNYSYKIEGWQYLLGFVLLGVFAVLGWRGVKNPSGNKMYHPIEIWVLNTIFIVVLFTVFYTLSNAGAKWFIIIPLALLLYVGYTILFALTDWGRATRKHYFAAPAGIVTGLLPLALSLARSQHVKYLNVLSEIIFIIILMLVYSKLA